MYFRNVQNCEKTGICVTDVKLVVGCWWWGVGGVLVVVFWWGVGGVFVRVETEQIGCLRSKFNSSAKGRDDTSSR